MPIQRIRTAIDVAPFLAELAGREWSTHRASVNHYHADTACIHMRALAGTIEPAWHELAATRAFLEAFAAYRRQMVAQAMVARLSPRGRVLPHIDAGPLYAGRDRFHLALSGDGCRFGCGDAVVLMMPGDLWWFDNKSLHWCENVGETPRIHVVFDLEEVRT